jgi:hypothetical protein
LLPACLNREAFGRLRQALALPIYALALILDYSAGALGQLAAWIAGDEWPA